MARTNWRLRCAEFWIEMAHRHRPRRQTRPLRGSPGMSPDMAVRVDGEANQAGGIISGVFNSHQFGMHRYQTATGSCLSDPVFGPLLLRLNDGALTSEVVANPFG